MNKTTQTGIFIVQLKQMEGYMHERVITLVNVPQQMLKVYYLYIITCHHA
jgi:hypothetical protein